MKYTKCLWINKASSSRDRISLLLPDTCFRKKTSYDTDYLMRSAYNRYSSSNTWGMHVRTRRYVFIYIQSTSLFLTGLHVPLCHLCIPLLKTLYRESGKPSLSIPEWEYEGEHDRPDEETETAHTDYRTRAARRRRPNILEKLYFVIEKWKN